MSPNAAGVAGKTERILRRSRQELEALAAQFVGVGARAEPINLRQILGASVVAAIGAAVILWLLLPDVPAPAAPAARPAATAADAEAVARRLAEQRERRRREMEATAAYLDRMAEADRALVREMTERAQKLARQAAAPPAVPAPKTAPAPVVAKEAPAPAPAVATSAAPAEAQAVPSAQCAIHVSELSKSGKLTYDDVARMKGARVDALTRHVFTPPVQVSGYGSVVFEVMPDGCVQVVRSSVAH